MIVLSWIAFFLLLVAVATYVIWSLRELKVPPRWIQFTFFGGSLAFLALFIVFTFHTMSVMPRATHAEALTTSVVTGKIAWQRHLCIDCHTILGNGAYYAPDLTKAWNRFEIRSGGDRAATRAALVAFMRNPPGPSPTRRGMPAVASDADAQSLADFLEWTSRIDTNGWPPAPLRKPTAAPPPAAARPNSDGARAFASAGCTACHSIGGGAVVGPDLRDVAKRYERAELVQWMQDSGVLYAKRAGPRNAGFPLMPALHVSDVEAQRIADYLIAGGAQ